MNPDHKRRTKIVSTLGPASEQPEMIKKLISSGVNVFRLNFSHGSHKEHGQRIVNIRKASAELNSDVAILADLQGPKIRTGKVIDGGMQLVNGEELIITMEDVLGEGNRVSTGYKALADEVVAGNRILMDDGLLEVEVVRVEGPEVYTKIINGGKLTSNKGINLPGVAIKSPALTVKDEEDLAYILTQDVDFLALSFVRRPEDIVLVKNIMKNKGRFIDIIAKIEKPEALTCLEEIIEECDGLMVARGDLGVEIAQEEVPAAQKEMITLCNLSGKPVIVATQMLDSMIRNPRPTRAEVSDVANAVIDGATAVMLSGESASGDYPVESVVTMRDIIMVSEKHCLKSGSFPAAQLNFEMSTDAQGICYSVVETAERMDAKAIICITGSGATAREIARYRSHVPIIAITDSKNRCKNSMQLTWGVTDVVALDDLSLSQDCYRKIEKAISEIDELEEDDLIVISSGLPIGKSSTNMLRIYRFDKTCPPLF